MQGTPFGGSPVVHQPVYVFPLTPHPGLQGNWRPETFRNISEVVTTYMVALDPNSEATAYKYGPLIVEWYRALRRKVTKWK